MKILSFFRKPYMAVLMAGLILFASCNRTEGVISEDVVDASILETIHEQIRFDLANADPMCLKTTNSGIEDELVKNMEFTNEYGIEALFESRGIDLKFLDIFEFYKEFEQEANIYQMLIDNFEISSSEDAYFIFNLVEVYDLLARDMMVNDIDGCLKGVTKDKVTLGCILAIAGTVATTAGAAFITGGTSLIVFLAAKGLATAAIIEACS